MALIKVQTKSTNLTIDSTQTFLSADSASGSSTLTVKNITGFAINQVLLIGVLGNEGAEIIKTHAATAPTGSTITLAANTVFPHSASTPVTVLDYDQIEFSTATTLTGAKSVLATSSIVADAVFTSYNDTAGSTGFYFSRFKNSITSTFSAYSSGIPVTGYTALTARNIIDAALGDINKVTSDVLTDAYAFQQINNCQMEVLREQKRWSFMQSFDTSLGDVTTGTWRVALPTDCDDQNTNKSIWNFKIGVNQQLTWIDKERWNRITESVAHTTLKTTFVAGATSIVLTDSSDFPDAGTIRITSHSYDYTANNRSTGTLTVSATATGETLGADVFEGASFGLPQYWTTFGGYIYFYPVLSSDFNQRNAYMDYYKSLTTITADSDTIVLPDPTIVQYYLEWKFLKKLNNGGETNESGACKTDYIIRREKLKQKDALNRQYRLRPTLNSIDQSGLTDDTTKREKLANFPNI